MVGQPQGGSEAVWFHTFNYKSLQITPGLGKNRQVSHSLIALLQQFMAPMSFARLKSAHGSISHGKAFQHILMGKE